MDREYCSPLIVRRLDSDVLVGLDGSAPTDLSSLSEDLFGTTSGKLRIGLQSADAGVVHQDVKAFVVLSHLREHCSHRRRAGHVGRDRSAAELCSGGYCGVFAKVVDDHRCAFVVESSGDRGP